MLESDRFPEHFATSQHDFFWEQRAEQSFILLYSYRCGCNQKASKEWKVLHRNFEALCTSRVCRGSFGQNCPRSAMIFQIRWLFDGNGRDCELPGEERCPVTAVAHRSITKDYSLISLPIPSILLSVESECDVGDFVSVYMETGRGVISNTL